jgi:Family of unknown function (DUF5989)
LETEVGPAREFVADSRAVTHYDGFPGPAISMNLLAELALFLKTHKKLVVIPILLLAIGIAVIVAVLARQSELAPMIYSVNGGLPESQS